MSIEDEFDQAMQAIYVAAKKYCKYNATYFLHMLHERGGLATARYLITSTTPSEGFTKLWECGRLKLTVEAVALQPEFASLFTEQELKQARERLQDYGYEV